ncbi:metallophosphoesterase [Deinococcus sp. YIM 134068]|uniref:metallophosphoesterase n=1 Tax=Deinococcus lichenicola TaxID=3118910 RepID=UPI002F93E431
MNITRSALSLGTLGLSAWAGVTLARTYGFEVNRYQVGLPRLRAPLRAVQLSDLHHGVYIRRRSVRAWVDAALALRPDVVLVTGDFVDADLTASPAPLFRELARLRAPLGVWAVWGNHDLEYTARVAHRTGQPAREAQDTFGRKLGQVDIRLLRNAGVTLRDDLFLAGVDDLRRGQPDLAAALGDTPEDAAVLLMSHNPDLLPEVPARVGLTLCGHTHGGQVCLPGGVPLLTSSRHGRRFAAGFVGGPASGFVSRGLGVTTVPLRLNCPPEIVVFDLVPG